MFRLEYAAHQAVHKIGRYVSADGRRIDQAVVLCGGVGSRLAALTQTTPKPLLPVAGEPFLQRLLFEIKRFGIARVLLLAGHLAEAIERFAEEAAGRLGLEIEVAIEGERAGTGGALWRARDKVDERFFLFNGDSWFDLNLLDLALLAANTDALATMALRRVADASRHGVVEVRGERVPGFRERGPGGPGLVNGGVYVVARRIVEHLQPRCSLEADIFPSLAHAGRVMGRIYEGFFLDIGIPEDYRRAETAVPAAQRRGAVFLDRDCALNVTEGVQRFEWRPTAKSAVKRINDLGLFAFVVTNPSGNAPASYPEADVPALHGPMQEELRQIGAHVDDFCERCSDGRESDPSMLNDLMERWPVDLSRSLVIGDREDVIFRDAAGIKNYRLLNSENLEQALARLLPRSPAGGE
ncbi:MAG TPA: sugar phosphate nucleotidyltransferase [Roseiarcus sp.]|nr:sugar phosphate nucleotidyltransferase [Roseiarcus sp.]